MGESGKGAPSESASCLRLRRSAVHSDRLVVLVSLWNGRNPQAARGSGPRG